MLAAFHGSFVDFVLYMGMTERYPDWFHEEVLDDIFMDSERFTFWVPENERSIEYHEKTLVEDYSVFLRKYTGEVMCTTYEAFEGLYRQFEYDAWTNSGVAAYDADVIEYVECRPGVLSAEYPDWFYEYFTEAIHVPPENESVFIFDLDTTHPPLTSSNRDLEIVEPLDSDVGQVAIDHHCVFLRNNIGEIRHMPWEVFLKHYNPGPEWSDVVYSTYGL